MRTRTVVTLYSVDLARPIVLMACSEPRNWFTALARHDGPQVVTITLVDDLLSEYGGRIARHVLTKPSDLLFFAGPCTGGSSWARLNKTRGIDTAEKIEAKQREFWRLFERFVEIKRHAMTKRAAILFELPGSPNIIFLRAPKSLGRRYYKNLNPHVRVLDLSTCPPKQDVETAEAGSLQNS